MTVPLMETLCNIPHLVLGAPQMRASPCHVSFAHTEHIDACSSGAFMWPCLGGLFFFRPPDFLREKQKEREVLLLAGAQMAKLALQTSAASGLRSTTPRQTTKAPSAMPTQSLPVPRPATQSEQDVEQNCLSGVFV